MPYGVDHITFITEDTQGNILIGTLEGGINAYNLSTQKVSYYGTDKNSREKLTLNGYWAAYKTRDNITWISTWGNLLYKINPYQNILPHTRIGKPVTAIAEDDAHTLWFGTEKGLIHKGGNGKQEHFLMDKNLSSLSNSIIAIEKIDNKFWLATGNGLYLFDPVKKTFSGYYHQAGKLNSLISDSVLAIKKGVGNKLWLGCVGNRIDLMDTKSGTFTHFADKSHEGVVGDYDITSINTDKKQNLWIGSTKGLSQLDLRTGLFKRYHNQFITISSIEDREGNIWCGTPIGLFKYNKRADDFLSFTDESAIINKSLAIAPVIEDHKQNLWFLSQKGIIRLNKARTSTVLYGKNQGVDALALTFASLLRQNGEILFSDTSGYFEVNSDSLKQNNSPPIVSISNFLINNEPVLPSTKGILSSPLIQTKEIRLNHSQNTFSFEFTNIDFVSAHDDTRLLYMLQNYDNAWRIAGNEKTAYYFNLPPGNYVFKVKAFNDGGVGAEKDVLVIISPPWWTRWWAYSLYALIVASIVYALYRSRINQLKTKQAEQMNIMVATQEGERKRISRDLHDEVGTKLSALKLSLSALHEKAINTNNNEIKLLAENSEQFITEVMQDVRRLLMNLSPTVIEEFGYKVAVEGLVNKINETNQLGFTLAIFGLNRQLQKDYELALYRITQELINNVLKHAEAKNVSLQIGLRDKKIILMIEDDGKGFDVKAHKDGYGLHNLEARTKLLRGTMNIDTQIDKGTTVLIEIPYNFNG